ncbi:MAG TPA: hypothetical protein VHZ56_01125, partial [Devosia sp.]|nr:hypothetical protein [Devosia sp.]
MTMIETPGEMIAPPPAAAGGDARASLLADVLAHIRLSGALFLRGEYAGLWALDSPGSCDLIELLAP